LQRSRCSHLRLAQRVPQLINNRYGARRTCTVRNNVRVTVIHARKESEDALPRERREHNRVRALFLNLVLPVVKSKKECLVFKDRTTEAGRRLMAVVPDGARAKSVIVPCVCI